jgi:RNA polymerase sigma-70 factor (ECF subfamily)
MHISCLIFSSTGVIMVEKKMRTMNETLPYNKSSPPMKVRKGSPAVQAETTEEAGPSRAFEQVFLEHWGHIYRLLVRLVGDPSEAEDLALETFLRLYQRPPAGVPRGGEGLGDPSPNLGGWLHRVATNLGLHSIRGYQRRERYELAAGKGALDEAPENRPAEIQSQEEERRAARLVLAQMNDRQARLLVMRYSGMSYKEIAAALGVSPTSVGPLLLRAEREFERRYRALSAS